MTPQSLLQVAFFMAILFILIKPIGWYMTQVYQGNIKGWQFFERPLLRWSGIDSHSQMTWREYILAILIFNGLGIIVLMLLQCFQAILPLNPLHLPNVPLALAFNTAVSFVTNTNWQTYSPESTMSYFTQMVGLTVQNFVSAGTGMAILVALTRALVSCEKRAIGNFWVDLTRSTLFILLPFACLWTVLLVHQGVIQNFKQPVQTSFLQTAHALRTGDNLIVRDQQGQPVTQVQIPQGPVASQIAIKQLGSNGGGYYNANSAHPYENPTPLSNFYEMLALVLLPAALCYTFGSLVQQPRQGWLLCGVMFAILIPLTALTIHEEQVGNPAFSHLNINMESSATYPAGNMEGKESRFGITNSALWAVATTASSNGSVNSMHDSFTPLGGLIPLILMDLGEVVFGGLGSGLYGMIMFVIIAVFIAGLMVGRTPEYLGKKIEPFEMKMAIVVVLLPPLLILLSTAIDVLLPSVLATRTNSGAHGLTEIFYAFSSMANNNGSAFSGLNANTPFLNILGGIIMLFGRFGIIVPVLAVAGSLAAKKTIPESSGTLPTHTLLFGVLLIFVIVLLGALTFLPTMALGPIAEHLTMGAN